MSATIKPQGKLTFLTKFAFGMGDFWTSIGNIAMATYLTMFYTDVVRLSPSMVASMLLVVRLVVAFWDLTVGILVDQTKSRWGKARPWMLFGGIAYGIAFLFLCVGRVCDRQRGLFDRERFVCLAHLAADRRFR